MPSTSKWAGGCGGLAAHAAASKCPARLSLGLLHLLMLLLLQLIGGRGVSGCTIAHGLRGSWLQYGYPNNSRVLITATDVHGKGRCAAGDASRGQYVLYKLQSSDEGSFVCYTCLVITRRSDNILQYKETNEEHMRCDPASNQHPAAKANTLGFVENICSSVGPDEMLHTLVKEMAQPVSCPFYGSFAVEHSRHGSPQCKTTSPLSTIEHCASDTQQAWILRRCPAIADSESLHQEIQCLGSWNDGDNWMYVRSKGDYRCIRYTNSQSGHITLYVSDDSACTSVLNRNTSPWVLRLSPFTRSLSPRRTQLRCTFPNWLSEATWRDVVSGETIELGNQRATHLMAPTQALIASRTASFQGQVRNVTISRTTCINTIGRVGDHPMAEEYLVGVMEDCKVRYQCLSLLPLADGVTLMRIGTATPHPDGACSATTSVAAAGAGGGGGSHPVVERLLIASGRSRICPFSGRYHVVNGEGEQAIVNGCTQRRGVAAAYNVGCRGPAGFDVLPACHNEQEQQYECLASWATSDSKYVLIGRSVAAPTEAAAAASGQTKDAVAVCYSYAIGRSGDVRLRRDKACGGALSLTGALESNFFPRDLHLSPLQQPGSCSPPTGVEQHRKSPASNQRPPASGASAAAASREIVASIVLPTIVLLLSRDARRR